MCVAYVARVGLSCLGACVCGVDVIVLSVCDACVCGVCEGRWLPGAQACGGCTVPHYLVMCPGRGREVCDPGAGACEGLWACARCECVSVSVCGSVHILVGCGVRLQGCAVVLCSWVCACIHTCGCVWRVLGACSRESVWHCLGDHGASGCGRVPLYPVRVPRAVTSAAWP